MNSTNRDEKKQFSAKSLLNFRKLHCFKISNIVKQCKSPNRSLRVEVFLYLLLGSFIPALIILLISAKQLRDNLHAELISKTEGGREVARTDLDSLVDNFKSSIASLSKEEFLLEFLEAGEESHENLALFVAHRKRTTASEKVAIYKENGSMLVSEGKTEILQLDEDLLDSIEMKKEEKIPVLTRFSVDQERGIRLDAYAPIVEPFYKYLQGILQETIFIDKKFIEGVKQKTGLEVGLFFQEKALIHTSLASPILDSSIFAKLIKTRDVTIQNSLFLGNITYHTLLMPILNQDGTVFGAIGLLASEKRISRNIGMLQIAFVLTLLGIIFLSFGVSYVLTKGIINPIYNVVKALRGITQGNLHQRIKVETGKEISELAMSFNMMAENLEKTTKKLAVNLKQSEQQNKLLKDTKKATLNILEDLKNEREKLEESEAKIRSVVKNTVDGIIVINEDGIIDSFNPAAEHIFGYKTHEIVGQSLNKLISEPFYSEYNINLKHYSRAKDNNIFGQRREITGKRKDGTSFSLEIAINEMRIGEKHMFTGILCDITERKKTQEQLRLQATALENAANSIIITDSSGHIQWINPAFSEMTGYSLEKVIGKTPRVLKSGKQSTSFYLKLWEVILSGQVWHGELINQREDGSYYYEDLTITPVFDDQVNIVSFVGISQDITARKTAEQQLIKQKEDLEKVNLELDSFVYTASHDLRAPLRGIASFATFLEEDYKDKLDKNGKDYLNEIRKGANRLSTLIDDLVALSRISRIKNPYEKIQVKSLIQSINERIKFDIKKHKVELKIQDGIPEIICDRIKLGVVFLNLINNAIKFSSKNNKENVRVEIGYKNKNGFNEFYVKDNGIGIDPKYHSKVFGIFKRLHKQREYEGTGAGLSIVKNIIDDLGGTIWIESQLGTGSTFYFTVPKGLKIKK